MRGGAGPPPQLSWLPPAFEGGPVLRQRRRQRPRRPAEVKPGCRGLGRRRGVRWPARVGGQGWAAAAVSAGAAWHPRGGALEGRWPVRLTAGRSPRGTCRSGPGRVLRRPEDCGEGGGRCLRGAEGPSRRSASRPGPAGAWDPRRLPGACCALALGMLLKGSGGNSADARGWKGELGSRSGRYKTRQDEPLNRLDVSG